MAAFDPAEVLAIIDRYRAADRKYLVAQRSGLRAVMLKHGKANRDESLLALAAALDDLLLRDGAQEVFYSNEEGS